MLLPSPQPPMDRLEADQLLQLQVYMPFVNLCSHEDLKCMCRRSQQLACCNSNTFQRYMQSAFAVTIYVLASSFSPATCLKSLEELLAEKQTVFALLCCAPQSQPALIVMLIIKQNKVGCRGACSSAAPAVLPFSWLHCSFVT